MKKIFTGLVLASLIIYVFISYSLLFTRPFANLNQTLPWSEFIVSNTNFIPFSDIVEDIKHIINQDHLAGDAIRHIFGNLVLLFPLGFYLPYFINKTSKIKIYMVYVASLIVIIEIVQLLTRRGVCDIDDFILNFTGAMLGFLFFKHTPIRYLFKLRIY